jgi:histidinol dehydrogenase
VIATRLLRFSGAVDDLSAAERDALLARAANEDPSIAQRASAIVDDVRGRGDAALRELALALDGVSLESLEVPRARLRHALDTTPRDVRRSLERAARNIATVHRAFMPNAMEVESEPGVVVGRRPDPLQGVGVYAPGGRAAYPSSVLMGAIPARVAGVAEVILCSPPGNGGEPSRPVLAAAALAEVDRVFAIGGAGAIAAMAFGTESVPRVDRIVGPGNAYVAAAKLLVVRQVAIDAPAGPSELVIVADDSADPSVVATEMVAQAEHDPLACVITIAVGEAIASRIEQILLTAVERADRAEIVRTALAGQGGVLRVSCVDDALAFSNRYSPEHLLLCLENPGSALASVRNAGTVFLGERTSVAFGDYMTGANHVLPTGGLARSYSGLSPLDFVRWTTYQRVTAAAANSLATDVGAFADIEGLPGHAAAARQWSAR